MLWKETSPRGRGCVSSATIAGIMHRSVRRALPGPDRPERLLPSRRMAFVHAPVAGGLLAWISIGLLAAAGGAANRADPVKPVEAKNLRIVGHNDLNGHGNGGEGLALREYTGGRRVLFLA